MSNASYCLLYNKKPNIEGLIECFVRLQKIVLHSPRSVPLRVIWGLSVLRKEMWMGYVLIWVGAFTDLLNRDNVELV